MTITHSQTTNRGNHREENEDSCEHKETRNGHIFVTCDGMGGAAEGKKASSIGVKSILEFFERETYENIQIALYQSLKFSNEQIFATAQLNPAFKGMGTTACVVLFQKDEMYFAHVGDSRIYLQTDGKLKHLTRDHSFVNQLVDQGTLKPNEAKNHPEKNRILKALGVNLDLEPTVSSQPVLLKKGDVVLLCSDGLTDMVSDTAIQAVLNEEKTIAEKTELLLQKALDNGGKDNITVQLIEITESPHSKTVFADKTPKDLATTLTGEGTINRKKYRFSKKHLAVLLPVLVLLGFLMVWNYRKGDEKLIMKEEITLWTEMPDSVKIGDKNNQVEGTVKDIAAIEFLFCMDEDCLALLNSGKRYFKKGDLVSLKETENHDSIQKNKAAHDGVKRDETEEIPKMNEETDKKENNDRKKAEEKEKIKQTADQNASGTNEDDISKNRQDNLVDIDPLEVGYFKIGKETNKKTNTYENLFRFKINNSLNKFDEKEMYSLLGVKDPKKLDSVIYISENARKNFRAYQKEHQ